MGQALEERLIALAARAAQLAAGVVLADGDLLALVLGGTPAQAARLLARVGPPGKLARAGVKELCEKGRLTPLRACRLKAALELGRRALDEPLARGVSLWCGAQVARHMRPLVGLEQEELHALGVDVHTRLAVHAVCARGAPNVVAVEPRDVFRPLLREGAQGLILVHNHPSGDPGPSDSDRALTERFRQAGAVVGIELIDHVIVARGGHYSFASQEVERQAAAG